MNKYNKKLKLALKSAYDLPSSYKKQEFLNSIQSPKLNCLSFLVNQLQFIRKSVWIIEILVVSFSLIYMLGFKQNESSLTAISMFSSIIPFFVLIIALEVSRSVSYNMAELEMTTRYNLGQVVISRLIIIGITNLLCLTIIIVLMRVKLNYSILQLTMYTFVPFLMTSFASLYTMNYIRNNNINYYCAGISILISLGSLIFINFKADAFNDMYIQFWIIAFIILFVSVIYQIRKFINSLEEYNWNLI